MSLSAFTAAAAQADVEVVSTDVFDTVLLRDSSTETDRLATSSRRAAKRLGVDPRVMTRLRWWLQTDAYRAVAVGRQTGDANLAKICAVLADSLGLDPSAARLIHQVEVDVDIEHLRPNTSLLKVLTDVAASGRRIIALSDTYYSRPDVIRMLDTVVGPHPIAAVYTSGDLGLTKHRGMVFRAVADAEGVDAAAILHVGDNYAADVERPRAASWSAVHLPRMERERLRRYGARTRALPAKIRRMQ